jgi:hypothetical protein
MDTPVHTADPVGTPAGIEVEEQTPDGGPARRRDRPAHPGPGQSPSVPALWAAGGCEEPADVEDRGGRRPLISGLRRPSTRKTTIPRRNWSGMS